MRRVTMVKKRLADGSLCRKCREVAARMAELGHDAWIDREVVADEGEPDGEGWQLARLHGVATAPFFIVEQHGHSRVYTVYLKFVREVVGAGERPAPARRPAVDAAGGAA